MNSKASQGKASNQKCQTFFFGRRHMIFVLVGKIPGIYITNGKARGVVVSRKWNAHFKLVPGYLYDHDIRKQRGYDKPDHSFIQYTGL